MHVVHTLLSWLTTLVFLPAFGLVLVVFDVLQRIARLFGTRPQEYVAGAVQWVLVRTFGICGTRLAVERDPGIQPWTSYVIVSNHQSMFDIPIFGALLSRNYPKYISKRELARWLPSISYNLRRGGHAIIDRGDRAGAVTAIRALAAQVRERGVSAVIFPEGTRARHGQLGAFKPAGALALLDDAPEVPVLAVAIDRSWQLLRFNLLPIPFGTRVHVRIGAPIERRAGEDRAALLGEARAQIEAALARWRAAGH